MCEVGGSVSMCVVSSGVSYIVAVKGRVVWVVGLVGEFS